MSGGWTTVARKEFRDAMRARSLWAVTALMVLSVTGAVYVVGVVLSIGGPELESSGTMVLQGVTQQGSFFITSLVSVLGLMTAYASIVGERSSGSLKLLLGLPYSRRDVVLGKLVGRALVLATATFAAFIVGFLVLLTYDELAVLDYLFLVFLTTALGVVYVSVGVALSAGVRTRSHAAAAAVGVFFFFKFLWDTSVVPRGVVYAVTRNTDAVIDPPGWYEFLVVIGPNEAYSNIAVGYLEGFGRVETFSAVVLVVWVVVPVFIGWRIFEKSDL
ncbi:MAG: ABC transporter permease subunit [Halobacteriales archaeon]|nr:ABC transporter permease subunit [Halobacteriales archaeon]